MSGASGPSRAPAPPVSILRPGLALCGLVLAHRLVVGWLYHDDLLRLLAALPETLTWQYPTVSALRDHLAATLLDWQATPPLPPALLGLAIGLAGWPAGAAFFNLALQAGLAAACGWMTLALLARLGARPAPAAAFVAVGLLSVDRLVVEYNSFGQTFYEPLAATWVLGAVLAWETLRRRGRPRDAGLAGLCCALAALTRAAFGWLFVPVGVAVACLPQARTRRHVVAFLLPVVVLQLGWAAKNAAVHGTFSVTPGTWAGSNLLHGLQETGLGPGVRRVIENRPDLFPDWLVETLRRRGLDPWPPRWDFYERFPPEVRRRDTVRREALGDDPPPFNSEAQRLLSAYYLRAGLRFAATHPGAMLRKLARSYALFWQPVRNYGIQYVDLFFVTPVIENPFAVHRTVLAAFRGRLPGAAWVMTGRTADGRALARPAVLPALSASALALDTAHLVALHLLLPLWLIGAARRRAPPIPPALGLALLLYAYGALVFNLPEHGENMRFRVTVEPLIVVLSYATLARLPAVWRGRRHRADTGAGPDGSGTGDAHETHAAR